MTEINPQIMIGGWIASIIAGRIISSLIFWLSKDTPIATLNRIVCAHLISAMSIGGAVGLHAGDGSFDVRRAFAFALPQVLWLAIDLHRGNDESSKQRALRAYERERGR